MRVYFIDINLEFFDKIIEIRSVNPLIIVFWYIFIEFRLSEKLMNKR